MWDQKPPYQGRYENYSYCEGYCHRFMPYWVCYVFNTYFDFLCLFNYSQSFMIWRNRHVKKNEEPKAWRKFKISWNIKYFNVRRIMKRRKSFRNHSLKYHYFCFRCIPCCLIPLLMPRFLRFHHFCSDPECNGRIGTFSGKYLKTWYFSQGTSWVATLCWKPLWTCLNRQKTDFNVLRGHSAVCWHFFKMSKHKIIYMF